MNLSAILLHKRCRVCKGNLQEILNLGNLRLNDFPKTVWEIEKAPPIPLILTVCSACGLVQLDRTVPADWMYRTYHYKSGVNETMVAELRSIVEEAVQTYGRGIGPTDRVLDIGANDGTLLAAYKTLWQSSCPIRVAFEPALNLRDRLTGHCDELLSDYFPRANQGEPYKIITAIACAYDLEDPLAFFQAIHDQLAPNGVAIVQFQDLGQQIESAAFDNVVHEHLEYYTLWSLWGVLQRTGLTIQRVTRTPINGGSLRVILRREEDHVFPGLSVSFQLSHESQQCLDTPSIRDGNLHAFEQFRWRVERAKAQIAAVVQRTLDAGVVLDQYGASTKGNITLQVLGLGPGQIRQAVDRSPEKVGLYTMTGIPIVSEETARADPAGAYFVTAWQFRESILRREQDFLAGGGTIMFPLPQVEIVRLT